VNYEDVITSLKAAYNRAVEERDQNQPSEWKVDLRDKFLQLLKNENKQTLLEIGAGTGKDSFFFQENGMEVTCTDLKT
jgi:ubiquinone/menaquinone biosynthesis C-methylase UbiE